MTDDIDEILKIAKFLKDWHYPRTSERITTLVEMLRKREKIADFESYAKKATSIIPIFRHEFVESVPFGQDYRGKCFDDVLAILLHLVNCPDERVNELLAEFQSFISKIDEIDESTKPLAELFAGLLIKQDRSTNDTLIMFHSACYIYLISVEGIFDDLLRWLYIFDEASKGNFHRVEEVEAENIRNIPSMYKRLFGINPVFLDRLQEKMDIRNAVAHAQSKCYPKINQIHFRSENTRDKRVVDYRMDFHGFMSLFFEIIDAIDSFRYGLRIIRISELLVSAYKLVNPP